MATFNFRPIEQQDVIDAQIVADTNNKINALMPYSGYTQVSKKLDNFVFKTDANFTYSVSDKNRYVKFGDTVVDTYGPELVTNGDFSDGTTGWSGFTGNWSVVDGVAVKTTTTNTSIYQANCVIGKIYRLTAHATGNHTVYINNSIYSTVNGDEYIDITFTATRVDAWYLNGGNTATATFDNISVREIQTADFSNDIPDVVEVITDGSNTTSVSVNAGDYVVDGSELVANGTFEVDTSGWSGSSGAVISRDTTIFTDGAIKVVSDGGIVDSAIQTISGLVVGERYIVKAKAYTPSSNVVAGGATIGMNTNPPVSESSTLTNDDEIQQLSFIFTATSTTQTLYCMVLDYGVAWGSAGDTAYFDDISVRRVSDTFRAIQTAPIGTALTDTAYFEDRTEIGVTNQVLSYHAYNTLTKAYEGIKTEVLFSDVSKEDLLNNDTWMSANGFSKVSKHLYSKGVYYVLPIGIWQSLNKGAYHPVLNGFGTASSADIALTAPKYWYDTDRTSKGTFNMFVKCTSGDNGYLNPTNNVGSLGAGSTHARRPDSKFYDIVYQDQFIRCKTICKNSYSL